MKRRIIRGLAVLSVLLTGLTVSAQNSAPPAVSADKGKLRILQDGKEVGTEQFELAMSGDVWIERGDTTLRIPGSETRATGQLRLRADGTPLHYDWSAQTATKASGAVDFENGTAKTTVNLGAKDPLLQDFKFTSPRVAILDNNLYDQYALLAMLYDWKAAGAQDFPVLIPQDTTPGSITIESMVPSTAGGAPLDGLRVRSADLEIHVFFDGKRHLVRLEVPDAKVVVLRE